MSDRAEVTVNTKDKTVGIVVRFADEHDRMHVFGNGRGIAVRHLNYDAALELLSELSAAIQELTPHVFGTAPNPLRAVPSAPTPDDAA